MKGRMSPEELKQLKRDVSLLKVVQSHGQIVAIKAANENMGPASIGDRQVAKEQWMKSNPGKLPTDEEINNQVYDNFYNQAFTDSGFGTGGKLQRAIQAASAVIQGLAGGDLAKAIAGGSAPYIANMIGSSNLDAAGKVLAHAAVNAALAAAQGNNALVGAAGAATAEMSGMIALEVYGRSAGALSETEKQTVSALATLAAGMAGGLIGNTSADTVNAAQAGKTTVENNTLGCSPVTCLNNSFDVSKPSFGGGMMGAGGGAAAGAIIADALTDDDDKGQPNIGKDLKDAEKAEMGGAGSGTGTPPPPENDPKQQNDKPVQQLNQKQESAIKKIDNTIKNALKDHDITGTLKDMDGNPVPKQDGGYWDHMQEMQNTLRGLRNHANTLKDVDNPEAQAAYGRATDAINKIESALKGHGI